MNRILRFIWRALVKPALEGIAGALVLIWVAFGISAAWLAVPFSPALPTAVRIGAVLLYWVPAVIWFVLYIAEEWTKETKR